MGKGSNTTTTNQQQSYSPAGAGYIQSALQQGQAAAQLPFNVPQAPVAGFSQDQQSAFNTVNQSQGMAQPYINQAANYFSPQGTQQFLNPYAQNVMASMNDLFGQQNSQNTGQLTQAAGGVGADRIAVGQSELAKQQGLAAGQTMSGLYNNAVQQAQSAGYGTASLGSQAQNAALQGAQAQLGTGGLQQQLSQAQLNAPYQLELAKAAFPYQQAQFGAGITGSLAPGLGGTTFGTGTNNGPTPSPLSQILGLGTAGVGAAGGMGMFNSQSGSNPKGSSPSYGGGNFWSGDAYGGSASNPLSGLSASDYGARGGAMWPHYDDGGSVPDIGYDEGGHVDPYGSVPDEPMNIASQSIVPNEPLHDIKPVMPSLNLNPPQQSQSSGGGLGDALKMGASIATLFANRGGKVGYAEGGDVFGDDNRELGYELLRNGLGKRAPDSIPGGEPAPSAVINPNNPYREPSREDTDNWRKDTDSDLNRGFTKQPAGSGNLPSLIATGQSIPSTDTADDGGTSAMSFAPQAGGTGASAGRTMPGGDQGLKQLSQGSPDEQGAPRAFEPGFAGSPWAALMAAGLGMAAGTSPFPGVNIGHGGLQGLKTLEEQRAAEQKDVTIAQAAHRLDQEAKFHEDQYTRMTPHQRWEQNKPVPMGQTIGPLGLPMTTYGVPDGKGGYKPVLAPTPTTAEEAANPVKDIVDGIKTGKLPPDTTGLYRLAPGVKAGLAREGFDLTQAQLEMAAAKKQILSLNGPQMVRFVGLAGSVDKTIDEVRDLSKQMELSGIPLLNQAKIAAFIQAEGNSPKGILATKYMTSVGVLKEEFANLANGGYAPTEPAWKLAEQQINGNYGVKQLGGSLDEVQRLIRYRLHGMPNMDTLGPGAKNRYVPGIANVPSGAPEVPPASGGAAAPAAAPAAAKPVPVNTPADAARLQPGTHYVTPDGKEMIR